MDFGKLFELLFTDDEFIQNVKAKINNKSWKYNKKEIMDDLDKIEEKTLWDRLLGADIAPTLRENFIIIKNYRNNIMHAHNITGEDYKKIKEIYLNTNKELDSAINDIINNKIEKLYGDSNQNFSKIFKEAIDTENIKQLTKGMNPLVDLLKEVSESAKAMKGMNSVAEQLKEVSESAKAMKGMNSIAEQLKEVSESVKIIKDINPIIRQIKNMDDSE